MWADNETVIDLIGFKVHADLLRAVVTDAKMLPLTVGVFGDWGGGKTSIMRMLERDLDPETYPVDTQDRKRCEKVVVIYVNTWLFEGYDDAKAALLGSVLQALLENKRFSAKVKNYIKGLFKSIDWMRGARLATQYAAVPLIAAAATGGIGTVPAVGFALGASALDSLRRKAGDEPEGAEPSPEAKASPEEMDVRTFRTRFGEMLKEAGIETLVVLVDDLDRCTPDRIIDNLEAVKLFLSVEQTAFVIGADRRVVEHAIRCRYANRATDDAGSEESARLVKDYLEKLVQVPYTLPRLSSTEIETYMTLLFCQAHLLRPQLELCLRACEQGRAKNRYGRFGHEEAKAALSGHMEPELSASLALCVDAAPLIVEGLKGNPRQVKRFLNALWLRLKLAKVARLENIRIDVLVKLMILEYAHNDRFVELYQWQLRDEGYPKDLHAMEASLDMPTDGVSGEETGLSPKWLQVRKWLALNPRLTTFDLRDYFWVSRDRLPDSFGEASMIPPAVRLALDAHLAPEATKRKIAMELTSKLAPDERARLLAELEKSVRRQPDSVHGFSALIALADRDATDAAQALGALLGTMSLEKVLPSTGTAFMTLYERKAALRPSLEPARQALLKATTTKAGKAANEAVRAEEARAKEASQAKPGEPRPGRK